MWIACVIGDIQAPYHDPRAVDVMKKIVSDISLDRFIINGDWFDARRMGLYPTVDRSEKTSGKIKNELKDARILLKQLKNDVKAKEWIWNDGNHEFRIERVFLSDPKFAELLEVAEIGRAASIPGLMHLEKLKIKYTGRYPKGCWLHPQLESHNNVWVEHGFKVNKKSGYTVSNLIPERMASCITNHVERLAGPMWTRALGKDYFGIENGNLSIIGEPHLGEDIYNSVPFIEPAYLNHRQGFSILYWDGRDWHPYTIRIKDGRAVFNGKQYKA